MSCPFLSDAVQRTPSAPIDHIRWLSVRAKELRGAKGRGAGSVAKSRRKRSADVWALRSILPESRMPCRHLHDTNALLKKLVDDGAYYLASKAKIVAFWRLLHDLHVNGEFRSRCSTVLRNATS